MLYFTVISAILLDPIGPRPPISPEMWPVISLCIQQEAIRREILDQRETSYIFTKVTDYETDLTLLRRRVHEFSNAPLIAETQRLPDRQSVNEKIVFNRAFRRHLMERHLLEQDRADILLDAVRETDRLYKVWDAVRDARCEFYYITVRRYALRKLKVMIGDEDYRAMELPPIVPVWRFNEIP